MIDMNDFLTKFPNAKVRKSVPEQIEDRNKLFEERVANVQPTSNKSVESNVDLEQEVRYPTRNNPYYTGD